MVGAWFGLLSIALFVAPKNTQTFDVELVKELVTSPFSGGEVGANPLFEALFNSLGVVPAIYASLLLPAGGEKNQPAVLAVLGKYFVGASFAFGYFVLGPYLVLRNKVTNCDRIKKSELGWFVRTILESKINAVLLTAFASFLYLYAFKHALVANVFSDFISLLTKQSTLACVSTCDLIILSLFMKTTIEEDMKRRRAEGAGNVEVNPLYFILPVLGPCLYLLTREDLREKDI